MFDCADYIRVLWESEEIQATYLRLNEFQIEEESGSRYFLDQVHKVTHKSYVPTPQDLLCTRERTRQIIEHHFYLKPLSGERRNKTLILVIIHREQSNLIRTLIDSICMIKIFSIRKV